MSSAQTSSPLWGPIGPAGEEAAEGAPSATTPSLLAWPRVSGWRPDCLGGRPGCGRAPRSPQQGPGSWGWLSAEGRPLHPDLTQGFLGWSPLEIGGGSCSSSPDRSLRQVRENQQPLGGTRLPGSPQALRLPSHKHNSASLPTAFFCSYPSSEMAPPPSRPGWCSGRDPPSRPPSPPTSKRSHILAT